MLDDGGRFYELGQNIPKLNDIKNMNIIWHTYQYITWKKEHSNIDFYDYYLPKKKELIAGWSSLVARRAHNPKVGGSNPSPATTEKTRISTRGPLKWGLFCFTFSQFLLVRWYSPHFSNKSNFIILLLFSKNFLSNFIAT